MAIDYTTDIVAFFRDLYPLDAGRAIIPPFLESWLYTAFPRPTGDPAQRNILHSTSKKQGKSSIGGMVALYMASRRRYSEVVIAASDLDQSRDRCFKSAKFAVENHPIWGRAKVYRTAIELDNGSVIEAISADWKGAAGATLDACVYDELWTATSELERRRYDELVIPPQRPGGVRWITSYAGFLGESVLLKEIWDRALTGERDAGELPIYRNLPASLLALIDQGEESWRMPWSTPEYMAEVKANERPNSYRRLWLNEWTSNESEFITPEQWSACYSPDVKPVTIGNKRRMVLGADASTSRDCTALVGVSYSREAGTTDVVLVRVWKPQRGILRLGRPTVDLDATIKQEILDLHKAGLVEAVVYDPYQLHSIALDLEKQGVRMVELPQTAARVEADQALYDAITAQLLRHYNDPTLNEHISNAVALETPRGYRLAKERTTRKIDAAVALSMAHFGALDIQKRTGGGYSLVPDPFDDSLPPDGAIWVPILDGADFIWCWRGTGEHRPGVTAENHHFSRTYEGEVYACAACVRELESRGYYKQQYEIPASGMSEADYEKWRYELRYPWTPPPSQAEVQGKALFQHIKYEVRKGNNNHV